MDGFSQACDLGSLCWRKVKQRSFIAQLRGFTCISSSWTARKFCSWWVSCSWWSEWPASSWDIPAKFIAQPGHHYLNALIWRIYREKNNFLFSFSARSLLFEMRNRKHRKLFCEAWSYCSSSDCFVESVGMDYLQEVPTSYFEVSFVSSQETSFYPSELPAPMEYASAVFSWPAQVESQVVFVGKSSRILSARRFAQPTGFSEGELLMNFTDCCLGSNKLAWVVLLSFVSVTGK